MAKRKTPPSPTPLSNEDIVGLVVTPNQHYFTGTSSTIREYEDRRKRKKKTEDDEEPEDAVRIVPT